MTSDPRAQALAELLAGAHGGGGTVDRQEETAPRSAEDAYSVQDRVYATLRPGSRPAAWKVGSSGEGAEPSASPILELFASSARLPSQYARLIGVEAEVAYRFSRDLPAPAAGYTEAEVAASVGDVLVAIELCDARISDWRTAPAQWKLADFGLNAALVVGSGTADWRRLDFRLQRAELFVGGRRRADVTGAHPCGDPFRLLPWLVAHCARRTRGIARGRRSHHGVVGRHAPGRTRRDGARPLSGDRRSRSGDSAGLSAPRFCARLPRRAP